MIEQGTPEWFALRRGLATGSHFADIMADGRGGKESTTRRNYKFKIALERVTGKLIEDAFKGSAHTERGKELEAYARMMYEAKTMQVVDDAPFIMHPELACGASPDGLIGDDGLLEIKCPIPAIHWEYLKQPKGTPPPTYKWQVYGEMWVTGRAWNDFVTYNENMPEHLQIGINRIHADEKIFKELESGIVIFLDEVQELSLEMMKL